MFSKLGNEIVNNNGKINPNQGKRDKISPNNMQNQAIKNMKNNSVNGSINGIQPNGKIIIK